MDILNLSQGALSGSGLPMQAESIAGQMGENGTAQTPTAFSDALLTVIDSMMTGQTLPSDLAVSAQPVSVDDDEDDADNQQLSGALLKDDSQQQLLETLLMTSQMPVQIGSYGNIAQQPVDDALMANAQPLMATQALSMNLAPSLQQQTVAMPSVAAVETPVSTQPLAPTLTAVLAPVTPVAMSTQDSSHSVSSTTTATAAPVTTTLKMDPEPSRWSEQLQSALGDRLQVQVKQQIQHATIRLDPPDMGKIDISMQVDNGRVQVQINASHAEVYRALQQTSNDLRQSLTEQNFVQVNVQVSSQSGGQQQGRGQHFAEQHNAIQAGAELAANVSATQDSRSDDSVLMTV